MIKKNTWYSCKEYIDTSKNIKGYNCIYIFNFDNNEYWFHSMIHNDKLVQFSLSPNPGKFREDKWFEYSGKCINIMNIFAIKEMIKISNGNTKTRTIAIKNNKIEHIY